MSQPIEINPDNFELEVIKSPVLTLVYFWAEWCGPCKIMANAWHEFFLLPEARDVKVVKVNVDENQKIAEAHNVMGIPTIIVYKNGAVVDEARGVQTASALARIAHRH